MTLSTQILNDLYVGQSTAHALAARMNRSTEAVSLHLVRMEKEGEVWHRPICDGTLIVWDVKRHNETNAAKTKP